MAAPGSRLFPASVWLVGCGNMGGAMLHGWLAAGLEPARFTVIRPSGVPPAPGVRTLTAPPADERPRLVILAVKPQRLDEVAPVLAPLLPSSTILVSILAGVEQASLRARFPTPSHVVRAMPNTPVAIGRGAISLFDGDGDGDGDGEGGGDPTAGEAVEALMAPLGRVEWIADERWFDVVAALTSSGPAFLFRFIDALAAGAATLGLPPDLAGRLALATVAGSAALAASRGEPPATLADQVASPGGMTRLGLDMLDADDRLNRLVADTLAAAVRRGREMGEAARTRC